MKLFPKFIPSLKMSVIRLSAIELAAVVGTSFQHGFRDPEEVDGLIRVVKATGPHVFAVDQNEGPAHLLPVCRMSTGSGSVWIINNQVDLNTYWDVYYCFFYYLAFSMYNVTSGMRWEAGDKKRSN